MIRLSLCIVHISFAMSYTYGISSIVISRHNPIYIIQIIHCVWGCLEEWTQMTIFHVYSEVFYFENCPNKILVEARFAISPFDDFTKGRGSDRRFPKQCLKGSLATKIITRVSRKLSKRWHFYVYGGRAKRAPSSKFSKTPSGRVFVVWLYV